MTSETPRNPSLNTFFNFCRLLTVITSLTIGSSLLLFRNSYSGESYDYIFERVNHAVWGSAFLIIGTVTAVGMYKRFFIWRLGCVAYGGILLTWAFSFVLTGSFHRSPPSFFIWLSAGFMSIVVALTVQPRIVDRLIDEVEKATHLIEGG